MDEQSAETLMPRYWRGVTRARSNTYVEPIFGAFDTETFYGRVFATGFYDGKTCDIFHGLVKDHLAWVLDKAFALAENHRGKVIIGAHYLVFDLGVLLWPLINPTGSKISERAPREARFSILATKTEVMAIMTKPCFATFKRGKVSVSFVDTFSFFTMGLAKALEMVKSETRKLAKPIALGKRIIPLTELRPYLENDTKGVFALLGELKQLHEFYGVKFTLSLPMLSGQIFRSHYLKKDFTEPNGPLRSAAMLSYHGGKNSFPNKAGWYHAAYDLDINSAYPEAMRQLPDFQRGKWVLVKGREACVGNKHGIYRITGILKPCPWGCLFNHDFTKAYGRVVGLWVTSYELREALLSGELILESVMGYAFKSKSDALSPFAAFVNHFYEMKEKAPTQTERFFYKLILNSLYGKFIARIEDLEGNMVAGSMFDPTVASLITGFVRAKVHRLEHKYNATHTATDGFITQQEPDPADMGPEMGKLKQVNHGPCLILRNKLYLHFDGTGKLKKSGLHGFEGSAEELLALWEKGKREYEVTRLSKWSQAWHTGIQPGKEIRSRRTLTLKS